MQDIHEIVKKINKLSSELKFSPHDFSPHLDIQNTIAKIIKELNLLMEEVRKEDEFKFGLLNEIKEDILETIDNEYRHCQFYYKEINKSAPSQKSINQYKSSVNSLINRIWQDLSGIDSILNN